MNAAARLSPIEAQDLIADRFVPEAQRRKSQNLGETLIRLGRLKEDEVERVLAVQAKKGGPFGKTAIKLGLLKSHDLHYALGVQLGFLRETEAPVVIPERLVIARSPYSPEAEQFRQMRTRLLTSLTPETLRLFSIAAAGPGVDAAYAAANLAAAFAQIGRHTLLIDASLRKPQLSKILTGGPRAMGLTDCLRGNGTYEETCRETLIRNLDFLPAGTPSPDPQILLGGKEFHALLEQARQSYEIVIVLTAPFGANADGEFVWAASKNVLALARKHQTRAKTLTQMRSIIRSVGAEIIGAAMIA